jgi:hypothetical protein
MSLFESAISQEQRNLNAFLEANIDSLVIAGNVKDVAALQRAVKGIFQLAESVGNGVSSSQPQDLTGQVDVAQLKSIFALQYQELKSNPQIKDGYSEGMVISGVSGIKDHLRQAGIELSRETGFSDQDAFTA